MDGASLTPRLGAALPAEQRTAVEGLRTSERRAPRNTCILRADDIGPRLRTLRTGWAFRCRMLVDGRRQIVGVLLPGDTFGIETLFDDRLDHTVWSATAVTYAVLDAQAAVGLFDSEPWFRRLLMRTLVDDKVAAERWMTQLGRCDAEERTASLILWLYERLTWLRLASYRRFRLELTQQELADLLGLHLIHLNRILSRLRARGLIMMQAQEVTLLDYEGLSDLVPASNIPERHASLA